MGKLKIVISFYMIASRVGSVYEVEFPASIKRLLNNLTPALSLGMTGTSLECFRLGFGSYLDNLILQMMLPVCGAALILLLMWVWTRCKHGVSRCKLTVYTALPWILRLFFLLYPSVANVAFEFYPCYRFVEGAYLRADVSVQCDTQEHQLVAAVAWIAIALVFGLLALNAALLFSARQHILKNKPSALSNAIKFLYREYEPHMYW